MRIFMIIFISSIYLFSANLTKSGDYVIDKKHHMMWQDTQDNINIVTSHIKASSYCEKLKLGGYSNWRVPTREDYKYIIDKTREQDEEPMINRAFEYTLLADYWIADRTWRNFGRWGYYIFFKSGAIYYENRTYPKLIRCVRDIK